MPRAQMRDERLPISWTRNLDGAAHRDPRLGDRARLKADLDAANSGHGDVRPLDDAFECWQSARNVNQAQPPRRGESLPDDPGLFDAAQGFSTKSCTGLQFPQAEIRHASAAGDRRDQRDHIALRDAIAALRELLITCKAHIF